MNDPQPYGYDLQPFRQRSEEVAIDRCKCYSIMAKEMERCIR